MNTAADDGLKVATARGRWVIAAAVLGSGIATLDATVVGIALPAIGRDYHTGVAALQWVVTGYSLTLAAFLLLGGSLGDRLGRKRIFQFGVIWFAVASAACGVAPDQTTLIVARVIQGIGGALLTPASLAILQSSFAPDERPRAIGAWSALGGVANAAGPLIGGYLIAIGTWRWVFFINLPIAALVITMTARHVPETRDPEATSRTDVRGVVLAVVALAALVYGLIEGPAQGWGRPAVLAALIVAVIAFPAFFVAESRREAPMLPLGLFADRQFSAANAVTFVVYAALGGALFLLPVVLQISAGYRPLTSGLALLPVTVIMLLFSARSGRLAARIGPRLQMSIGPMIVGAGLILLVRAADHGSYATQVLPAAIVFGAGLAVTVAPLTSTAMGAAPPEHAGSASAVNNVVARAAGLLAVAILPVAAGISGPAALHPAHLAHGFRLAVTMAGLFCVIGGLIAAVGIRNPSRARPVPVAERWACPLDGPGLGIREPVNPH
ncbi:MAG TPA: MFS transporter [Acidimicrobiales bacterium]|jgi:EmrB/QacA subfamily drug resistance transporter|nr:MFS transporter [Acidimicrobiales bacterium]